MAAKSRLGKGLGALFPPLPGEELEQTFNDGQADIVSRETIHKETTLKHGTSQSKTGRVIGRQGSGSSEAGMSHGAEEDVNRHDGAQQGKIDGRPATVEQPDTKHVSRETIDAADEIGVASDEHQDLVSKNVLEPVDKKENKRRLKAQSSSQKDADGGGTSNKEKKRARSTSATTQSEETKKTSDKPDSKKTSVTAGNVSRETSKQAAKTRNHIPSIKDMTHPSDLFFGSETDSQELSGTVHGIDVSATSGAKENQETDGLKPVVGGYLAELRLDQIGPNIQQPRTIFDEDELRELSASIREVGVLEPVVVRKRPTNESVPAERVHEEGIGSDYELIMGERRWRASKLAGLSSMPAIVKTTSDEHMLRDALLENLHRVALNPLEEAAAYQQMMNDFGMTQEQLSQSVSKSRPQIANMLRLLNLPASVQKKVAAGVISAGHARALLGLSSAEDMEKLANRIITEGLSVRSTEEIVAMKMDGKTKQKKKTAGKENFWNGSPVQQGLENRLDTKVTIKGNKKSGRIEIVFSSPEDMDRIVGLLMPEHDGQHDDGWV
jgi:ParB family transcriptional regulator, chromosome partitioning protein